ncbi:hypothetical protein HW555_008050 [Spodoptera exigua]|uniref:BTB domain-containing protein n=1 Tax=Spodoptera exigua TaxID=7107 RepID=A0A835GFU0_SPOEX|nr:hypothetical protein HW555_008050 [Spodoptera exigua]
MSQMEQLSLSWDSHQKSICNGLSALQQRGEYVDMTLAADGYYVKVHQMVVSLVSPYLKDLISTAPCPHPVIFLYNISYTTLSAILEYIYTGEVQVPRHKLEELLSAGKALHIRGLKEMDENKLAEESRPHGSIPTNLSITKKLKAFKQKKHAQEQNITPPPEPICKIYLSEDDTTHEETMAIENEPLATDVISTTDVNTTPKSSKKSDNNTPHLTYEATRNVLLSKDLQYTVSNQGGLQSIYNRYIYNLRYVGKKNGKRFWRCVQYANSKCPANICTDDNNTVTKRTFKHNHPFEDTKILKKLSSCNIFSHFHQAETKAGSRKKDGQMSNILEIDDRK